MIVDPPPEEKKPARVPVFNVPTVVVVLVASLAAIHATIVWLLGPEDRLFVTYTLAFHAWMMTAEISELYWPAMRWWTPVSYSLLHGDWGHLGINCLYLVAFATPVARRFGTVRFLALMLAGALGGAFAHWIFNMNSDVPMIGASAAVSAAMGAAVRFVLEPGVNPSSSQFRPALSLGASLANRGAMTFVVVWFALNWLFGSGIIMITGQEAGIAWQAHIGGFLIGWLGFMLFDPPRYRRA